MSRHISRLGISGVRAVVTDIEGTTTPISFVKEVLFPYAAEHLADFVRAHQDDEQVKGCLQDARREAGDDALELDELIETLLRWIDEDRKVTPLKTLQGLLWRDGYHSGAYRAPVFDDAVKRLRQWHTRRIRLFVYSSGSVEAQKLLFAHTDHGDLRPLFSGYFDTTLGPKKERESYIKLARELRRPVTSLLFLSDSSEELDAARAAGFITVRLVRPGEAKRGSTHREVDSFEALEL